MSVFTRADVLEPAGDSPVCVLARIAVLSTENRGAQRSAASKVPTESQLRRT